MERSALAVIIPAFNEAASIARVVTAVSAQGQAIVVDDRSRDQTADLAAAAGAIVVRHAENRGYDGALNSGFAEAARRGFRYAITFDADGQHDDALIGRFARLLDEGNVLVAGVRPAPARLGEWIFAGYTRLRFGLRDPLCGMKGYDLALYREQGWFDSYRSIGTELALFAVKRRHRFAQVPVLIHPRHDSPRFGSLLRANVRILRALACSLIR